jgi:cell division protein ZapA
MSEKLPCNITVALEEFSLQVGPEEEAYVRKAAKLINERMDYYKDLTKIPKPHRVLALVALDFVIDNLKFDHSADELKKTVMTKILQMESMTDGILD